ncbi:exodeoxyribonuclease I [Enterobacteriaceae endosymbiont of Plateumaris consimilis]|uniref:exodeoxyribonuclease I n=1 Tax=Enterobacteriaceae endosymbiont of Plateumaris consimilis TaxID=2675794 RepID=UPI001449594D|nr:exodeoxyribonuclease I [Enterobacteriaceae endosymbiont of Plateumaris consimilis]QJC28762.1 exodeoxyribonuclease I [Enterobacteriaceae endosymbiont of Plateumaris consimilis]
MLINTKIIQHQFNFLFYDYETFGLNPSIDKIAQFACIRTNINLEPIEDPIVLYCKLPMDYIPDPISVIINNINPQIVNTKGIFECDLATKINKIFSKNYTCIVGYNNIIFDDEFSRNLFYRNFYDPYNCYWNNNNSRWDILNLVKACYILRPEGINWPKINNIPVFNLEKIANINNIKLYYRSHDALSDVYRTIEIAKLIKKKQLLLYNYFFKHREKKEILKIINLSKLKPLIYISHMYKNSNNNIGCIAPLFWSFKNKNILIAFDLIHNINEFIYSDLKNNISSTNFLVYIKFININNSPLLLPINILKLNDIERLNFNLTYYQRNFLIFKKNFLKIKNIIFSYLIEFYNKNIFFDIKNVDTQLYKNFFGYLDLQKFKKIHQTPINKLNKFIFDDPRANQLLFRYRARNFPETLNHLEKIKWDLYKKNLFNKKYIFRYINKIKILLDKYQNYKSKIIILNNLLHYFKQIINIK